MQPDFYHLLLVVLPSVVGIVAAIKIFIKYLTKSKDSAKYDFLVGGISFYFVLLSAGISEFYSTIDRNINDLKVAYKNSKTYTYENISQNEISDVIHAKLNQKYSDVEKNVLRRVYFSKGMLPGISSDSDYVFGKDYFSNPFVIQYFIGCNFTNQTSQMDNRKKRKEMFEYLVSLLIYHKWDEYPRKVSNRMKVFHFPLDGSIELFQTKSQNNVSGIIMNGSMIENINLKSGLVVFEDDVISKSINDEINQYYNMAIDHLRLEMSKKDISQRCPCTLFATEEPADGLRPMSEKALLEKIKKTINANIYNGDTRNSENIDFLKIILSNYSVN